MGLRDFAAKAFNLLNQAKQKVEESKLTAKVRESWTSVKQRIEQGELTERFKKILATAEAQTTDTDAEQANPDRLTQIKELMLLTKQRGGELTDQAAVQIAEQYKKITGRETTPEQVKRVAIQIGVAALAVFVLHLILQNAATGHQEVASSSGAGSDGFDNSFEGQSYKFFADKGGLNIETHVIDQDGCQLS